MTPNQSGWSMAWLGVAVLAALLTLSVGLNAYLAYGLADAAATIKGCHIATEDCTYHRDGLDRVARGIPKEQFERVAGNEFMENVFLGFSEDGKYQCSSYGSSATPLFRQVVDTPDGREVAVCR